MLVVTPAKTPWSSNCLLLGYSCNCDVAQFREKSTQEKRLAAKLPDWNSSLDTRNIQALSHKKIFFLALPLITQLSHQTRSDAPTQIPCSILSGGCDNG